jgi:glyoxylase-like metal-dependent hydrolase (beta-lactamase superfamily II)
MSRPLVATLALVAAAAVAFAAAAAPARAALADGDDDDAGPGAVKTAPAPAHTPGPQSAAEPTLTLNPGDAGYKGVAPGAPNLPPHPPKLPIKSGPQRLTWSGFQIKDGVPTVFLELTGTPEYRVDDRPNAIVVTLKNTVAPLRNNRRPLRVGYFNTSVKDVEAKGAGRDLRVTIRTDGKTPHSHKEHVEPAAGGFQMLLIEIPEKQ